MSRDNGLPWRAVLLPDCTVLGHHRRFLIDDYADRGYFIVELQERERGTPDEDIEWRDVGESIRVPDASVPAVIEALGALWRARPW